MNRQDKPHGTQFEPVAQALRQIATDVVDALRRIEGHLATTQCDRVQREWLTVSETADSLQVSAATVDRLISSGQLKAAVITTRAGRRLRNRYRIRAEWIDHYLLANVVRGAVIKKVHKPPFHEFIK